MSTGLWLFQQNHHSGWLGRGKWRSKMTTVGQIGTVARSGLLPLLKQFILKQ
jgi:hypothetical protein